MSPFCFWAKKKPQAFYQSLRLCRLLDIQFFVFPHSISITTETVMWFSMRLLRSLSPSPSNTTWRENNVKRRISTRFLFVAKLSLRRALFIENGIKFKFGGFMRFYKDWKNSLVQRFQSTKTCADSCVYRGMVASGWHCHRTQTTPFLPIARITK